MIEKVFPDMIIPEVQSRVNLLTTKLVDSTTAMLYMLCLTFKGLYPDLIVDYAVKEVALPQSSSAVLAQFWLECSFGLIITQ